MMTDRDLLEQIGKLRLRVKELEGQRAKPMTDKTTLPEPVAYQYRWKIDGEWVNWRFSDASQKHPELTSLEERPLYSEAALQEALDRATTAEAALAEARKVIERQDKALKPMSNAVYNDNGDMTISVCHPTSDECVNAYWAERKAAQWLSANQKETPNAGT